MNNNAKAMNIRIEVQIKTDAGKRLKVTARIAEI
jgi:hypothetical protein|tara:strand:- start:288 stop:389 length:102 start_codon:yes stop_codon:yes gene_type:complete